MVNSKLGTLIREGRTSREIKEVFRDFTLSIDYFTKQGYKESTAKRYLERIRKNDKNKNGNDKKASKLKKAQEIHKVTGNQVKYLWASPNANFDQILLDTSALGWKTTLEVIKNAKEVIILEAVMEEMDKKKQCSSGNPQAQALAKNVRAYSKKILVDTTNKYQMVPFKGEKGEYCDNVIIQYMSFLPRSSRVTLLASDLLLASKAKMHGYEYIVYSHAGFTL